MKRWLLRVAVCLTLGAITTVAVAWGCAWLSIPRYAGWEWGDRSSLDAAPAFLEGVGERVLVSRWQSFGFQETDLHEIERWNVANSGTEIEPFLTEWIGTRIGNVASEAQLRAMISSQFNRRVRRIDAGWPFLALTGSIAQHSSVAHRDLVACIEVTRPWTRSYATALPLSPRWQGLVLNALFYSALFTISWAMMSAWRRRRKGPSDQVIVESGAAAGQGHRAGRLAGALLLCMFLGAVTTVLVAWGFAWQSVPLRRGAWITESQRRSQDEMWTVMRYEVPGDVLIYSYRTLIEIGEYLTDPPPEEVLPGWGTLGSAGVLGDNGQSHGVHHVEGFGWPMLAMACVYEPDLASGVPVRARLGIEFWQTRWIDSSGAIYVKTLPVIPIWQGFAFNMVVFAVGFWLTLFAPFEVRRRFRRHRGRCLKCGYDLRGQFEAGCPECGWNREG